MSYRIGIEITAADRATATLDEVQHEITETGKRVSEANDKVVSSQKKINSSASDNIKSFSALATSAWALYQGYDNLQDAQVNIDKANLTVKTSAQALQETQDKVANTQVRVKETADALEAAHNRAADALLNYGSESKEYKKAMDDVEAAIKAYQKAAEDAKKAPEDLAIAQDRHNIAVDRAKMLQDNLKEATVSFALGTIPTAITMITQLTDKKNILGATISGLIEKLIGTGGLNSALGTVGGSMGSLGTTISTAIGGAGGAVSGLGAILGGATATTAGAMIATAGAAGAVVLAPALIAEMLASPEEKQAWQRQAIEAQAAAMDVTKTLEDLAAGTLVSQKGYEGWINKPTMFLAGEAGPEHVEITPAGRSRSGMANFNTNIYVGNITKEADEERLAKRISRNQLNEWLRRTRL